MSTPALDYANPRVFFEDAIQYRSAGSLALVALLTAFGLGIGLVPVVFDDPVLRLHRPYLFGWATVFLSGAGYFAWLYLSGREDRIRVTEDGIEYGRRFWPWGQVEWLGGIYVEGDGTLVNVAYRTRAGGGLFDGLTGATPTPLTRGEFARLTREVEAYLSVHCPRVKVERRPLPPASTPGG